MDEHDCLLLTSVKTFILSVHSENVKPNLKLGSSWSLVKYDPKLSHPSSLSIVLGHFRCIFLESSHSHREGKAVWWKMSWLDFTLQASLPASWLLSHTGQYLADNTHFSVLQIPSTKHQILPLRAFAHAVPMAWKGFLTCFHLVYSYSSLRGQLKCRFLQEGFPDSPDKFQAPREHSIFFLPHITNRKYALV